MTSDEEGRRGIYHYTLDYSKFLAKGCCNLTVQISLTANHSPAPFLPLRTTIAPGNIPSPADPSTTPLTPKVGLNLSKTRDPDPPILDDSK